MGFVNPFMFGLTVFIILFIILYIFRKQYEPKTVTSNMLWEQVMKEWESAPFFDRLQRNILFWLQLSALILLLFALIKPYWNNEEVRRGPFLFIVDTSASMSAKLSDGKTILDHHKEKMTSIVQQMAGNVTLITAGSGLDILLRNETDKQKIFNTIDNITTDYGHEDLDKALRLAASLADSGQASLHLFTDGVTEEEISETNLNQYIEVHNFEAELTNFSIQTFGIGKIGKNPGGIAVIQNQSESEAIVPFTVKSGGGVLYRKDVHLMPGSEEMVVIGHLPEKPYYQAKIDIQDDYEADNFWTAVSFENNPPVYAVGDVNPFIVRGLESIGAKVVQTDKDVPADNRIIVVTENMDIYQRTVHPVIYFEPLQEGKLELVSEAATQKEDPLFEYVDLANVNIYQSNPDALPNLEIMAASGDLPLIQKGKVNGIPQVAVLFPIEQSDWPLHPNFPVFLYNAYQWLVRQSDYIGYFQPGEERWLNLASGQLDIFSEDGKNLYSVQTDGEIFKAPDKPGLYQAVNNGKVYYFSVLLDERERMPKSGRSFNLNESIFEENVSESAQNDFLWFWLAVSACLVLFAEWEVYRRHA